MAIVIGKKQLLSTDLKYFKALQGIGGKTLFDRFKLAESNIINKNIDTKYQHFLAYPVVDGDAIVFHGIKYNETPQIFQELQGEDLSRYTNIKNETISHYNGVIDNLENSGKTVEAVFLADAIKYIDDRFIYCYDDIVVLGVWGMKLRDNVREDISEICKTQFVKAPKPVQIPEPTFFTINYNAGDNGNLYGNVSVTKQTSEYISNNEIPQVEANDGYEFAGWDENPNGHEVTGDKEFTALYNKHESPVPPYNHNPSIENKLPWYLRFWNWLKALFTGNGCLKWLLWLIFILLLLLLFSWLFRNCSGHNLTGGAALSDNDSTWVKKDPRVGDGGGIYDPHDPYTPVPTPPAYKDILPPQQGVLPPIDGNPEIIPGNPSIIGNRINILMENEDKSIMDLAKDFKVKYPDDKYKVVYYDNVVKRMQIEIPSQEREKIKQEIPTKFSPIYKLFVFDEALLEGEYSPNDPAFKDNNKNWYLQKIKVPEAWDVSRGSDKITVAIVDNGFNLSHPELKSKVVQPYNVWTHSNTIFPQKVDHGTHVAGTALAIADNNLGLCGIAPNCKFMPIQVANEKGIMTTTSVLDGILYALYQGADVINVSLGGQFKGLAQFPEREQIDLIQNHFKEEERLWLEIMRIAAKHNATIVVAAGNDNILAGIDALQRPDQFITVSAIDRNNSSLNKANFSNYGPYSKISAPGVGIYSTVGANSYQIMDGTSMAAPIVSGAVALMKSIKPNLSTKEIICILQNTGLPVNDKIGKLIQLDKAMQIVKAGQTIDCSKKPSSGDVQITLNWNNYNDLDLYCIDPTDERVWCDNKVVSSGGQLDVDMNVNYPGSITPIENIFWPKGKAPNGIYKIYLINYKNHEPYIYSTPYTINVKYGGKNQVYKGIIKKEDKSLHICSFTLGSPTTQNAPNSEQTNSLLQQRKKFQQELDRIDRELKEIRNRK
ncbi:S8 family serine peptidase [Flavobacterium luteum]|uniref:S8 family serine peptidase n=1 Tax=Flavobacterium luteum TaxID=2026654 RepID=A0A7J5AKE9_9FLAO|nr:S8 family serine peptidase [Flavobacterium luteum]KAB1157960.1 S8 family serine peptidase [Flavobacterium luteum]